MERRYERSERPRLPLASARQRLDFALRIGAIVLSGVPSTTLIPLGLTRRLFPRFRSERFLTRLHLMIPWARFCVRHILGARLDVTGQEHLPRPSRGHLLVCNHQGQADILVLIAALESVAFLSKQEVRKIPVIGSCALAGGTVFVDRASPESRARALDQAIRMCQESVAVLLFPEGTTSTTGGLRERVYFKGLDRACQEGLTLVPLAIYGTQELMPETLDRVRPGSPVAIRIGAPLPPDPSLPPRERSLACWQEVARLHQEARDAVGCGSRRTRTRSSPRESDTGPGP